MRQQARSSAVRCVPGSTQAITGFKLDAASKTNSPNWRSILTYTLRIPLKPDPVLNFVGSWTFPQRSTLPFEVHPRRSRSRTLLSIFDASRLVRLQGLQPKRIGIWRYLPRFQIWSRPPQGSTLGGDRRGIAPQTSGIPALWQMAYKRSPGHRADARS